MAQTEKLDNRLLNRGEEGPSASSGQDGAAGKLRESKRGGSPDIMPQTILNTIDSDSQRQRIGETGSPRDWATAVREATNIKRQAERLKEKAKGKIEQAVAAPIKQATSKLLQQAWINLLDSFGLTLIWINIHVFLKWTLGEDLFCKLGEEWLPKQVTQAAGPGGDAAKSASKGFGLLEVIVLLILDLIVLAVIFAALAIIVMIVDFMQTGFIEKAVTALKVFWGAGWETMKVLYDLFANL